MLSTTLSATADSDADDDTSAVQLSLTVSNEGVDPLTLRFRTGQRADFIAHDADTGGQVWQHAEGRMFTQVLGSETLAPGESATYQGTWSDPPTGSYRVVGELAAEEHDATARTTVTVE
ncbi:hypothetical protein J2751_000233 [Halorubrum alkaliphilum]|uniref:Intracellular proteinase inhibitor BsuPI domain-containing protein n=1 Tax=Halorubrum alkaliphilum TaxID=261290 RepID=A0A8T4GC77_9EURY|nr:BsuPI-related putative proteinase inhibitor [Halorubrum alkaliphilum]MBP1921250.1 hypothetical protein [Halorubrum alkaliphilum]